MPPLGGGVWSHTVSEITVPVAVADVLAKLAENVQFGGMVPTITEKLGSHHSLVKENNRRVFDIKNAGKNDPKNTEVQDNAWERAIEDGTATPEMVAAEKKYQKAVEVMEAQRKALRDAVLADVPKYIGESLTEKQVIDLRKLVNEGKSVIVDSEKACEAIAGMADQMLTLAGIPVEGGIWSLMEKRESLVGSGSGKGKAKSTSGADGGKATRIVLAEIEGERVYRTQTRKSDGATVKAAHFNYLAEKLSKEFNDAAFAGNQVTAEDIEKAYYDSKGAEFRDSQAMPVDHTFTFTKDVEVQNPNDDSTTVIPQTKNIRVMRWTRENADTVLLNKPAESADAENKPAENTESADAEKTDAPAPESAESK